MLEELFEEAVIKSLENLDNKMNEIESTLEYEVKMKFSILNKSNELIYRINKQNEERLKYLENILSKLSMNITHLYETVRNHEEQLRKLSS